MALTVRNRWDGDVVTVALAGELDPPGVPALRAALGHLRAELPAAILVDVSALSVDSDLPLAAFPPTGRAAGTPWPPVPLLLFGATAALLARLARHRFVVALADRAAALAALAPPEPARRADLPFAPAGLHLARQLTGRACHDWGLADNGEAELVASELTGNALRHADPPLRLLLTLRGDGLHVGVRDGSAQPPRPRPGTVFGLRGLGLVEALSTAWGSAPAAIGKAVWALLPTRPVARSWAVRMM